jgi:hypothetical protein
MFPLGPPDVPVAEVQISSRKKPHQRGIDGMLERLTPGDRLMAKAGLKGVHRQDCRRHGRDPYDTPILPLRMKTK